MDNFLQKIKTPFFERFISGIVTAILFFAFIISVFWQVFLKTDQEINNVNLYFQFANLIFQALALIGLLLYVFKTWEMADASRNSANIAEKALLEMKESRDAEIAPYVVAYLDVQGRAQLVHFVLKNTGRSMATDVKVTITPTIKTKLLVNLNKVLPPEGIPSLPPGYCIDTVVDSIENIMVMDPNHLKYNINVVYFGGINREPRQANYVSDLDIFTGIRRAYEQP